jgi:hypothetical protein
VLTVTEPRIRLASPAQGLPAIACSQRSAPRRSIRATTAMALMSPASPGPRGTATGRGAGAAAMPLTRLARSRGSAALLERGRTRSVGGIDGEAEIGVDFISSTGGLW